MSKSTCQKKAIASQSKTAIPNLRLKNKIKLDGIMAAILL